MLTRPVNPEEVGFAAAAQIGRLRTRVRGCGRQSQEMRYLISSAEEERLNAQGFLDTKRGYWAIEACLHYRLDDTLAEDQSRVRSPRAARVLGMCRRAHATFRIISSYTNWVLVLLSSRPTNPQLGGG